MVNTEKPTTKAEAKKNIVVAPKKVENQPKAEKVKKVSEEKKEKKTDVKQTPKIKKTEAIVNGTGLPVSTKYAVGICKFIKKKKIGDAIRDLEEVSALKKPVPMTGELSHQKGKGISSAKFPQRASKHFIVLLKSLASNATANELDDPVIVEAIANLAPRPYGRFGRIRKKRTHIRIVAKDIKKKQGGKKK
jgi:large subunit ribosomal protein L22